jgi:O-antigen/teichoic acid export membrane protein
MRARSRDETATSGRRALVGASFWGIADQALMSAVNFGTMIVLARELVPAEFGAFVLAYTALLFVNGLQTALITQPHNVLGQSRQGREYVTYTSSTAAGQLVFSGATVVAVLVAAAATALVHESAALLLVAVAPAAVAWQAQEFARRVLYTEGRIAAAFLADAVSYGGQLALLIALAAFVGTLGAPLAFVAVAATSAAGALFAGWRIRGALGTSVRRDVIVENWAFGKWLGAAIGASWLAAQVYFYLVAAILGATASGGLKAAQMVLGPLNAFLLFLFTVLPIRFAATREGGGDRALAADVRRTYAVTAPFVAVYCAAAALSSNWTMELLYGDVYAGYANVVILFAAYYVILQVVYLLTAALNARRLTRPLFVGNVYAALIGGGLGWLFVEAGGVEGATVGMIVGALVLVAVFWRAYRARPGGPLARAGEELAMAPQR